MAFRTIVRRLKLNTSHPILSLSTQFSLSYSQQSIYLRCRLPFALDFIFQAYHQTAFRPCKHNPHVGCLRLVQSRRFCQIIRFNEFKDEVDGNIQLGVNEFLERVQKTKEFTSGDEAIAFLDNSNVRPNDDFIFSLIWALKEEWKFAFLVFKWGEKWDCVVEKTWCLMIWLLGNHKKFSTAWTLIHELHHASMDTQQVLLIIIDRYTAANYVDKAIQTFHMMQKFKFSPDQRTYLTFLKILCDHGNIEEAEEFMFLNKKFFPLETVSFNIILNGWCNIAIDIYEAKRVWREMSNCCIVPDGTSYTHLISCHSSVGNLFDSLRLYDEMKKRGWFPGVKVYNSLTYILTRENCLNEALKIVGMMKETCQHPNSTTYNSIIRPLCEAAKFEEARTILALMIKEDISPTIDTYHALLEGESIEGTLGVLNHMRRSGLGPSRETFLLILGKAFKSGHPENALKIWLEMKQYKVMPDREHYIISVEGLAKCGLIVKAREFYSEMRAVGLVDDPSLKKLIEDPPRVGIRARKENGQMNVVRCIKKGNGLRCGRRSVITSRKHRKQLKKRITSGA